MATEITSKSELIALAAKLDSKSKEMVGTMDNISTVLKSVSSYDGIDVPATITLPSMQPAKGADTPSSPLTWSTGRVV